MSFLFFALLAVHVAYAACSESPEPRPLRRRPPARPPHRLLRLYRPHGRPGPRPPQWKWKDLARVPRVVLVTQGLLFALACWYGLQAGAFSRALLSPLGIALGLAAGHAIFGASLLIAHRSARDAADHLLDVKPLWAYAVDRPGVLGQFLGISLVEELTWRVAAQPLLIAWTGSVLAGIGIVGVGFSIAHKHFFKNEALVSLEFLAFALLLGALYYTTQSFLMVIAIHAVRDIEIAYLDFNREETVRRRARLWRVRSYYSEILARHRRPAARRRAPADLRRRPGLLRRSAAALEGRTL